MMPRWRSLLCNGLFTMAALAAPLGSEAAQVSTPAPESAVGVLQREEPVSPATETDPAEPEVTVPVTPGDMARIRRALGSDPAVRINDDQLRFYMEILVKRPTFAEFARGYDFKYGPTRRGNPMTHGEFLAMVTPREMQSQVGITARETLEFALTNWLSQSLIKKAFEEIQKAKTEREIQEIRDRIDRELAIIKGRENAER